MQISKIRLDSPHFSKDSADFSKSGLRAFFPLARILSLNYTEAHPDLEKFALSLEKWGGNPP